MKTILFNKDTLNFVKELGTNINNSLVFNKKEDRLCINGSNPQSSVAYQFSAPVDHFGFDGADIAFFNYTEFNQLVNVFGESELSQVADMITIAQKGGKSNIVYKTSNKEIIKQGPSEVNFPAESISFSLAAKDLQEIKKMVGLINAQTCKISIKGNEVLIALLSNDKQNTFNKSFARSESESKTFSFNFTPLIYSSIPEGEYTVSVGSEGIIKFTLKNETINFTAFTAEEVEE